MTAPGNKRTRGRRWLRLRGMLPEGCMRTGEGESWQGATTISMVFMLMLTSGVAKWVIVAMIVETARNEMKNARVKALSMTVVLCWCGRNSFKALESYPISHWRCMACACPTGGVSQMQLCCSETEYVRRASRTSDVDILSYVYRLHRAPGYLFDVKVRCQWQQWTALG